MESPDAVRLTDANTLKALAHPLRLRILGSLRRDGPATSAVLARRLRTDTGRTSFHLRRLAQSGMVIEAPELGKGRERWWAPTFRGVTWDSSVLMRDQQTVAALLALEEAAIQTWMGALREYLATRSDWDAAWVEAASFSDYAVRLNAEGLQQLLRQLVDLVQQSDLGDSDAPGTQWVSVQLHAFPRRRD